MISSCCTIMFVSLDTSLGIDFKIPTYVEDMQWGWMTSSCLRLSPTFVVIAPKKLNFDAIVACSCRRGRWLKKIIRIHI